MSADPTPVTPPSQSEIRDALHRVLTSRTFSGASQLSAFLRYIVETTLAGQAEEIKGVTVATKALGRGDGFNPKTDAIVRVEAGRLRRAIERYYNEDGANDPIAIEIPRRGYVPSFSYRNAQAAIDAPTSVSADDRDSELIVPAETLPSLRVTLAQGMSYARPAMWALLGIIVTASFYWRPSEQPLQLNVIQPTASLTPERKPTQAIGLVIQIDRPTVAGPTAPAPDLVTGLFDGIRDAVARFDDIRVIARDTSAPNGSAAPITVPADYRLLSSIETAADGPTTVTFRLQDPNDDSMVWARTFEFADPSTKAQVVRDVSMALLRPYGVIQSNERGKLSHNRSYDPHYRCVVEANDYWRNYDPASHMKIRSCLERAIADDPTFAGGYALLARIYLREYQVEADGKTRGRTKLDEALRLAGRAVELKPESARSHYVMMDIQIAEGNISEAISHGEMAISLNPFDENALVHFGNQLVAIGDFDRGLAVLEPFASVDNVRQARLDFSYFLASYMKGDYAGAAKHAHRMPRNSLPLGIVARALAAYKNGNTAVVRREVTRLAEVAPAWRTDIREQIGKIFHSEVIIDRLAQDMTEVMATVVD